MDFFVGQEFINRDSTLEAMVVVVNNHSVTMMRRNRLIGGRWSRPFNLTKTFMVSKSCGWIAKPENPKQG